MAIEFNDESMIFSLHTRHSTYQIQVGQFGHLLHLYYGSRIKDEMDYLMTYMDRGFSGNPYEAGLDKTYSLDALPQEYPTDGTGDYRITCMTIKNTNGTYSCDLRYKGHNISKGKYHIPGLPSIYANEDESDTLEVFLEDAANQLQVTLYYGVIGNTDIITRSVRVVNCSKETLIIEKALTANIDFLYGDYDWYGFHGRHTMERQTQRSKIIHGIQGVGSKRGTSSHQYNPFLIIAESKTTEDHGNCYGLCFVYSGDFKAEIELDQYNQTRITMGLQDEMFSYQLKTEASFYTPEVVMTFSDVGLEKLTHNYHDIFRNNLIRGKYKSIPKPILINNWEATYFDYDGEKIINIAKQAVELGVEMLVLDDGWFGNRDGDMSGLGDWTVNEKKLGCSLYTLVNRINEMGMKFGLWFEPEMVNEDSELYREHPEWAFIIPNRDPVRSRFQLVLDYSRVEVVDYIYEKICNVLDSANIEYIKWDFNRSISDVYSISGTSNQGAVLYHYMLGLYNLLERIVQRYPNLLIESCSGGGGRFDAGMLHYSPQIWTSDNTDAIDRIRIQEGTSFAYPITTFGSHVSDVPNHQTGRTTPFETRAIVAMVGSFGYELDLNKITTIEKDQVKQQIVEFHKYWDLIHRGDYYRLTNAHDKQIFAAWQYVRRDGSEALLCSVTLEIHGNMPAQYVKFKGLLPEYDYIDMNTQKRYSGKALMCAGLPMPFSTNEYQAWQVHLIMIAI